MRYIIHCLLRGEVEKYQHSLVSKIEERFGLKRTKKENLETHFTLKYSFTTNNLLEVEKVCENFAKTHQKEPVKVNGISGFPKKVIFINVNLSLKAKKNFKDFIKELKNVNWVQWDKYDGDNLHFHSTIAEECNEKYAFVKDYLKDKEKSFDCWFDNITILKLISGTKEEGKWDIHKQFNLK
jgi:2'-5' RNA ligase